MKKSLVLVLAYGVSGLLVVETNSIQQSTARLAKEEVILKDIFNSLGKDQELEKMLHEGLQVYKKRWQTTTNVPAIAQYEKALYDFAKAVVGLKSGKANLDELVFAEKAIEEADKAVTAASLGKKKFEEEAMKSIHEAQASLS